jgi:hypothetical protein
MTIEINEGQRENAFDSIRLNSQSGSNTTNDVIGHSEKHRLPRILIIRGIVTPGTDPKYRINVFPSQLLIIFSSIVNHSLPSSNVIETLAKPENAELSINETCRGILIDFSDELENASDSIRCSAESSSNEIEINRRHSEKHSELMTSTPRGMIIEFKDEPEKVWDSIVFNADPFSKQTDESNRHEKKQPKHRISTFRGIVIRGNEERQNA